MTLLSGGSNVLVHDSGVRGLTIGLKNLKATKTIRDTADHVFDCEPGVPKAELLRFFLKNKSQAALFLAGIPGDVGGGVVMNAGISENIEPREFVDIVDEIDVLRFSDLTIKTYKKDELLWSYRHCQGWALGSHHAGSGAISKGRGRRNWQKSS